MDTTKTITTVKKALAFDDHWRSTLAGYSIAVITACKPLVMNGHFNPKTDWIYLLAAGIAAIGGRIVSDKNVVINGKPLTIDNEIEAVTTAQKIAEWAHNDRLAAMAQVMKETQNQLQEIKSNLIAAGPVPPAEESPKPTPAQTAPSPQADGFI